MRRFRIKIGARLIKTAVAVSLATGFMSLFDPTRGLVGAGVSAAMMIAPSQDKGKQWARSQFVAVLLGALMGLLVSQLFGWAPWLTGLAALVLIKVYGRLGYHDVVLGGLTNMLFIMEHPEQGLKYATFRFASSVVGLVIGSLVNMYVLPYNASQAIEPDAD